MRKFRKLTSVLVNQTKIDELNARFSKAMNDNDLAGLRQIILTMR